MRHLIVTVPDDFFGYTREQYKATRDKLNQTIENWVRDGGPLIVGKGVTVELIDLTAIAPGHRVCCL